MKQQNIPFDAAKSSIVLVYSNGERYHVEAGQVNFDLLNYNDALQVTTFAYDTGKVASHTKAKGVYADTLTVQTIIIDALKSGLAFAVVKPCPVCNPEASAMVYTCAGIRSSVHGEDLSFIGDALAYGLTN